MAKPQVNRVLLIAERREPLARPIEGGFGLAASSPHIASILLGYAMVGAGLANVVPALFSAGAGFGSSPGQGIAAIATAGYGGLLTGPINPGVQTGNMGGLTPGQMAGGVPGQSGLGQSGLGQGLGQGLTPNGGQNQGFQTQTQPPPAQTPQQ